MAAARHLRRGRCRWRRKHTFYKLHRLRAVVVDQLSLGFELKFTLMTLMMIDVVRAEPRRTRRFVSREQKSVMVNVRRHIFTARREWKIIKYFHLRNLDETRFHHRQICPRLVRQNKINYEIKGKEQQRRGYNLEIFNVVVARSDDGDFRLVPMMELWNERLSLIPVRWRRERGEVSISEMDFGWWKQRAEWESIEIVQ